MESTQSEIVLGFSDPDKVFPLILKFIYTGDLTELSLENAVPILAMADHYLIKHLQSLCSDFIKKQINRNNTIEVIKQALDYQVQVRLN